MQTQQVTTENEIIDDSFFAELDELVREKINISEELIASAAEELEEEEERIKIYEEEDNDVVTGEVEPVEEPEEVETETEAVEEPIVAAAPAAPAKTKKRGRKPSETIAARLDAELNDYTLLTPDWSKLSDQERLEKFNGIVDSMANYVGDKAVNLFAFLKTGGGLNVVTARAFEVFLRDGMLTGGDEGNIIKNLLTKPYSIGTARSQGNQMLQLFTLLEIGTRSAKGTVTLNPNSVLLERVKTALGK